MNIVEDSLRFLAPTQKKLTSIESQRIMTVATDTHKSLKGAMCLPYLMERLERYSVSLGEEAVSFLKEYNELSEEYMRLYHLLEVEGTHPGLLMDGTLHDLYPTHLQPINASNEMQFLHTKLKLKNITKNLLREMRRSPATTDGILNEFQSSQSSRTKSLLSLLDLLNEIMKEKLLTTSSDEKRKLDHVTEMRVRQRETENVIAQLEQELIEAKKKRDEEVSYTLLVR